MREPPPPLPNEAEAAACAEKLRAELAAPKESQAARPPHPPRDLGVGNSLVVCGGGGEDLGLGFWVFLHGFWG